MLIKYQLSSEVDAETVEKGKRSLLTNLMLMLDGSTPVTEDIGRQLIFYGRRIPMEELKARVEVSESTVRMVGRGYYDRSFVFRSSFCVIRSVVESPSGVDLRASQMPLPPLPSLLLLPLLPLSSLLPLNFPSERSHHVVSITESNQDVNLIRDIRKISLSRDEYLSIDCRRLL